jgi:hypothetical protein
MYLPKVPGFPKFLVVSIDDTTVYIATKLVLTRASVNSQQSISYIRFWVVHGKEYKMAVFWNVAPCCLVEVY